MLEPTPVEIVDAVLPFTSSVPANWYAGNCAFTPPLASSVPPLRLRSQSVLKTPLLASVAPVPIRITGDDVVAALPKVSLAANDTVPALMIAVFVPELPAGNVVVPEDVIQLVVFQRALVPDQV